MWFSEWAENLCRPGTQHSELATRGNRRYAFFDIKQSSLSRRASMRTWVYTLIIKALPSKLALIFINLTAYFRGKRIRFYYDYKNQIWSVREKDKIRYFASLSRGASLYANGLDARNKLLARQYLLDEFTTDVPESDGWIVDVGSNYGDFYHCLPFEQNPLLYLSVEPGRDELKSLKLNIPDARIVAAASGEEDSVRALFLKSDDGDSSLIRPRGSIEGQVDVVVRRLDSIIGDFPINRIRLLKVEAEGFEPEVLKGAEKAIQISDMVVVDGGLERGEDESETISFCINFLLERSFVLRAINLDSRPGVAVFTRVP